MHYVESTRKLVPLVGHPTFSRSKRVERARPLFHFFFFLLLLLFSPPPPPPPPSGPSFTRATASKPGFSSCSDTTELLLPRKNRLFSRNKSGGALVAPRSLFVKSYIKHRKALTSGALPFFLKSTPTFSISFDFYSPFFFPFLNSKFLEHEIEGQR